MLDNLYKINPIIRIEIRLLTFQIVNNNLNEQKSRFYINDFFLLTYFYQEILNSNFISSTCSVGHVSMQIASSHRQ